MSEAFDRGVERVLELDFAGAFLTGFPGLAAVL